MQEQNSPIGYLFESIPIYDPKSLNNFIDNLTIEQSIYVLTQAVHMAYTKNIFSITESEILSKAMRTITLEKETPTE